MLFVSVGICVRRCDLASDVQHFWLLHNRNKTEKIQILLNFCLLLVYLSYEVCFFHQFVKSIST